MLKKDYGRIMKLRACLLFCFLFMLPACAMLQPSIEAPEVQVTSFKVLPSDSIAPRFEIGLHVINPNRSALKLEGLTYSVKLEGHKVLSGVANDLPMIEGYGEGDVVLQASADLINSLSLLSDLLNRPRETVTYELSAKLDVGAFLPSIRVGKTGEISLMNQGRK
jgi:LEA14-like dessication related protein